MTETNDSGRGRRDLRIKVKTAKGRKLFAKMAIAHEKWIVDAFDGLSDNQHAQLYQILGTLKRSQLSQAERYKKS